MKRFLLLSILLLISSCGDVVKSDFGIAGVDYLTIIVPAINENPRLSSDYITDSSVLIDSILFKGDQHFQTHTIFQGYSYYPSPKELEGKKYISSSNTVVMQRQYRAKSDFKLFLKYTNNTGSNNSQYIFDYESAGEFIHSDILEFNSGSYYKTAGQIYNDFVKDIYLAANFEFVSKFDRDSINANFKRLLKVQNTPSMDPASGKTVKSYFIIEYPSRADIFLTLYPYQNGSKAIITALIYPKENNHIIDFTKDYEIINNQLQKVVND